MIKFFCDLSGTFTSSFNSDREELVTNFITNLECLTDEEISFSFCSSNVLEDILPYVEELRSRFISNKIIIDYQYGDSVCWKEGVVLSTPNNKMSQILNELKQIKYSKVFYADNSQVMTMMTRRAIMMVDKSFSDDDVVVFSPNETLGLESLNELMREYIEKKKNNIKEK